MDKWSDSQVHTLLSLYAKKEMQCDIDVVYVTSAFLQMVQMHTEERPVKVCRSQESSRVGRPSQKESLFGVYMIFRINMAVMYP